MSPPTLGKGLCLHSSTSMDFQESNKKSSESQNQESKKIVVMTLNVFLRSAAIGERRKVTHALPDFAIKALTLIVCCPNVEHLLQQRMT
jgi:hypothetical protein